MQIRCEIGSCIVTMVTVLNMNVHMQKLLERHFDRFRGNYIVFSVFYILLAVSSVVLDTF